MKHFDLKKAIESIIFISRQPVTVDKLAQVFPNTEKTDIRNCLTELVKEWGDLGRGFHLARISDGYQFRTCAEQSEHISNFNKKVKRFRLSKAALEVIAIIAYKQPITRLEVESIRGVDSSGIINALLEKRIIEIKGRKEVIGKPFIYGTTKEFLEVFGLIGLGDLPTLKEIEDISKNLEPRIPTAYED